MTNNLTPSGDWVLEQLGINRHTLRADFPTREQRLQYRAIVQWITDYKPKSDTNLEKVKGYLEALNHLYHVEDWERASKILFIRLNTPTNQELHDQLDTWGYYSKQIYLYSRIVGKISPSLDTIFFMVWAKLTIFWETMPKRLSILRRV